jgi:formylglycine-generating enzyme required for sulfatase activity
MPLVFAAVLFILSRRGGTIRFEINDPGITVRFAGEEVQINDGDNAYRFVAGDHELSVTHGDLSFITKDFKLSRGEDVRLQVTFLDQQLLVERDGKPLWVGQEVAQNEAVADVLPSQLSSYSWPKNLPSPAIVPFTAAEAKTHQEAWAERLGVAVETENSIGMKLRLIPPGEFLMGSSETELAQETRIAREKHMLEWVFAFLPFEPPQHHVTLTKPFGIGIYEVTRGQFRQFVDATGYITESEKSGKGGTGFKSRAIVDGLEFSWKTDLGYEPPQTDESPVVNVSWNDAAEFCKWLSEKEGETYRLPSEAEWEYACRGGNPGRFCFGDDSALIHKYGWIGDGLRQGARRVGEGAGNSFGLFDMHGNVWEFCQDFHGPYPDMAVTDPTGPVSGDLRVGRGGTWGTYAELSRSAYRSSGNHGAFSAGFRVAKDLNVPRDSSSK